MPTSLPDRYEIRTHRRATTVPTVVRAEGGRTVLRGHFATFNEPYDLGYCFEQVDPKAFDRTLREKPDVVCLWNHDSKCPLARTTALTERGKLTLSVDDKGAVCEFEPSDTSYGRDLIANVDAGIVTAMSFGFDIRAERFEKREDGTVLFTLLDIDLWECSPVTWPANPGTDIKSERRSLREGQVRDGLVRPTPGRRMFLVPKR